MSKPLSSTPRRSIATNNTLPNPVTPLLGRDREIEVIRAILDLPTVRLVTLSGPGGIGKTRLVIELGRLVGADFAHGAQFVSLASVSDATLVPAAVARAFGIAPSSPHQVNDVLESVLREQHALLILDNLEHVVDGVAPWLAELLATCPRLHVLATSRVGLHISGEHRYPLEPLHLPGIDSGAQSQRIAQSSAVQLFVQRARAVRPDLSLSDSGLMDMAAICRTLDGLPLAIELAAAWAGTLSLPALRDRLTSRLPLLTQSQRDGPPRHRTMRTAIAWSYDLLPESGKQAFRRVSVFSGGFTSSAAEQVIGEDLDAPVLHLLAMLVDHSLLRFTPNASGDDRYDLLETVREYALECLAMSGEEVVVRQAHAVWYQRTVMAMQPSSGRPESPSGHGSGLMAFLGYLEAERDNLRAALAWLTGQERIEEALVLAVSIWPFRTTHGHDVEARSTIEALLVHSKAQERTLARAHGLHAVANYTRRQGDLTRSIQACEEALTIFQAAEDHRHAGHALVSLAWTLMDTGRAGEAIDHYRESLRLARMTDDAQGSAAALDLLGWLHAERDELQMAATLLEEALALSRESDDRVRLANVLCHAGLLAMRKGDVSRAAAHSRESVAIARDVGDVHVLPSALTALAATLRAGGDIAGAESCQLDALEICRRTGYTAGLAFVLATLGALALDRGHHARAHGYLRDSVAAFERVGLRFGMQYCAAICFDIFAWLALDASNRAAAARFVGMADALYDRNGVARPKGEPFLDLPCVATVRGALDRPELTSAWREGYALSEATMVEEALAFALPESLSHLDQRVPDAVEGELTPRELEVVRLMADGLTNQEIADALFVGQRTVASHAASIIGKLGASTRTGAVAHAIRHGLA